MCVLPVCFVLWFVISLIFWFLWVRTGDIQNGCYDENWQQKIIMQYNGSGDVINCYNERGQQEWNWVYYYDNWQIASELTFQNWLPNWLVLNYYENWQVKNKWTSIDGNRDWKYIEYYDNGKIMEKWKYNELWADWLRISYYEDGVIKYRDSYKNWKREGAYVSYYPNWQTGYEANYVNWELEWQYISYNEDWSVYSKWVYIDWNLDWNVVYYSDDWNVYVWIYEGWEIVDLKWKIDYSLGKSHYFNSMWEIYIRMLWNKFTHNKSLTIEEFRALNEFFAYAYVLYYSDDSEDFFNEMYSRKDRTLLALYTMIHCLSDGWNQYLFIGNPETAQDIYFKNCPRWCIYSDEVGSAFICE